MFNLSLTACSFHLRKTNSRGNTKIFNLNMPLTLQKRRWNRMLLSGFIRNIRSIF